MHSNLSGPTKAVCYREGFSIRGVCCKFPWYMITRVSFRGGQGGAFAPPWKFPAPP